MAAFLGRLVNPEGTSLESIQEPVFSRRGSQTVLTWRPGWSRGLLVKHALCQGRMTTWPGLPRTDPFPGCGAKTQTGTVQAIQDGLSPYHSVPGTCSGPAICF